MGDTTNIAWCDKTWNPWSGCTKVSPGCKFCYMYREKKRYGQDPSVVVRSKTTFRAPLKWTEPARVFTCSWSDFFIEEADPWRDEAWRIIADTPHLTYLILTKRPERVEGRLPWRDDETPWPHVMLGVSAEDQATFDLRTRVLSELHVASRFWSLEPLLAPIDASTGLGCWCGRLQHASEAQRGSYARLDIFCPMHDGDHAAPADVDWVILGGESGSEARPCDVDWLRALVAQCRAAHVPCFVKQLGAHFLEVPGGQRAPGELPGQKWRRNWFKDRAGADPSEWAADLNVREWPKMQHGGGGVDARHADDPKRGSRRQAR